MIIADWSRVNINTSIDWIERMVSMNYDAFELYLKKEKRMTDHEAREVISRISWVETTLNVSLEKMLNDGDDLVEMKETIMDVVRAEDKASLFYDSICLYKGFSKIQYQ